MGDRYPCSKELDGAYNSTGPWELLDRNFGKSKHREDDRRDAGFATTMSWHVFVSGILYGSRVGGSSSAAGTGVMSKSDGAEVAGECVMGLMGGLDDGFARSVGVSGSQDS